MAPIFANMSCDPFDDIDSQCVIGAYVPYAVNASSASDYVATIAFAQKHNIRLVIRNTGHDYIGKSTGAGALALWTHHLKDIDIFDYNSQNQSAQGYTGMAMKMGAGVQASEAQDAAHAQGLVVVQGDCPTVGLAGGYTQGGGTSPLSSVFGLGADQVLEWEVVTTTGKILTATPYQNSDLYWALSGGGGGTYGAVLSMTVKLYEDTPIAGATLSFTGSSNSTNYWSVIREFLLNLPAVLDAGTVAYWELLPGNIFAMPQAYLPNGTAEDFEELLQPTLAFLNQSGISYGQQSSVMLPAATCIRPDFGRANVLMSDFSTYDFPTFQDAFDTMNPNMTIQELNIGGRLIPRSLAASNSSAASLASALEYIISNNGLLAAVSMNVGREPTYANSANPYWRETLFLAFFGMYVNPPPLFTLVAPLVKFPADHLRLFYSEINVALVNMTRTTSRQTLSPRTILQTY